MQNKIGTYGACSQETMGVNVIQKILKLISSLHSFPDYDQDAELMNKGKSV